MIKTIRDQGGKDHRPEEEELYETSLAHGCTNLFIYIYVSNPEKGKKK